MTKIEREAQRDKLLKARDFANKLGERNGYTYDAWLQGREGYCKAGFDREGQRWSLNFTWQPDEGFDALQLAIEKVDFALTVAQREFTALKFGAAMKAVGHSDNGMGQA